MLRYVPGESLAHRLDPRSKILFQVGFAVATFATPADWRLVALGAIALGAVAAAGLSPLRALRAYWVILVVLALGPLIAGLTWGAPWFRVEPALASLRSVVRLPPLLLVSAAFVYSTPVRETRAAIQRHVPGRFGQLLGVGVGLTFRFVPVVRGDLGRIRDAVRARNGTERPVRDRMPRIASLAVVRAFRRADQLSTALQARCFAWNPTLPALRLSGADYPVLVVAVGLAVSPLV